jgi:CheY-like chemotaxis protein
MLAQAGCEVTEARDGLEGLSAAMERRFDLILMDISMPNMDGLTATQEIRRHDGPNAETTVIALTAHALPTDIERFKDAGMNDVVVKPIERDRLIAALQDAGSVGVLRQTDDDPPGLMAGLARDDAEHLVQKALEELSSKLATLSDMTSRMKDVREARADIHKLTGIAAVIGATALRAELAAAETASAAGDRDETVMYLSKANEILALGI